MVAGFRRNRNIQCYPLLRAGGEYLGTHIYGHKMDYITIYNLLFFVHHRDLEMLLYAYIH